MPRETKKAYYVRIRCLPVTISREYQTPFMYGMKKEGHYARRRILLE